MRSGGVFFHVEHGSPDGNPRRVLQLEHPQIPAGRTVSCTRTFVDHVVLEGDHSRITGDIDLMIVLTEFVNCCVLAEIGEPGKKGFPSLDPPGKTRKNHDNLRVHHRRKVLDLAAEPCLVDLTHCFRHIRAFGFLYHELQPFGVFRGHSPKGWVLRG